MLIFLPVTKAASFQ